MSAVIVIRATIAAVDVECWYGAGMDKEDCGRCAGSTAAGTCR